MNNGNITNITNEEKLLAMLSHLSMLFGGIILPIILWAVQKDKSNFVRFHSLQAIFFHIAYLLMVIIITMVIVLLSLASGLGITFFATRNQDPGAMSAILIIVMAISIGLIFLVIFGMIGYSIYLAVKAYGGNYIMVPVIGKIIYRKIFNTL
jgi:uncharacterized Tic20 family protein